ncbi:unnamed protein product [Ectocarpus sp. 12 AP-2014]
MNLTDEQRQRMEENRARARARLREKRETQIPAASAIDGGETRASPPPTSGPERPKQDGGERAGGASSAGGADAQLEEDQQGPAPPSTQQQPPTIAAVGAAAAPASAAAAAAPASAATPSAAVTPLASGSTRCGGGGARGTRAGGGGGNKGRAVGNNSSSAGDGAGVAAIACEGCGGEQDDARMDKELLEAFGISVCRTCKLSREDFQYVSTKDVKDTYLLPQGTIAVLKFVERDNPHHSSWTKMKLYLRREVVAYSYKRWGSEDGLAAERRRRESLKYDRSLARTQGIFKRSRSETEGDGVAGGFL